MSVIQPDSSHFAVLGGWLLLDDSFGARVLPGRSLMLAGMLATQCPMRKHQSDLNRSSAA